jgi:hypothetical protein
LPSFELVRFPPGGRKSVGDIGVGLRKFWAGPGRNRSNEYKLQFVKSFRSSSSQEY